MLFSPLHHVSSDPGAEPGFDHGEGEKYHYIYRKIKFHGTVRDLSKRSVIVVGALLFIKYRYITSFLQGIDTIIRWISK
jgi:hypothetical protein